MLELNKEEFDNLRSQIGTSRWGGTRYAPMAFTEQGVAQLSTVLSSERAIQVNIGIIRIFTKVRKMLLTHKDLLLKMEKIDRELAKQGKSIKIIFEYLNQLIAEKEKPREKEKPSRQIGYKQKGRK